MKAAALVFVLAVTGLSFALAGKQETASGRHYFDAGNDLYSKCTDKADTRQGYCIGYVVAVADLLSVQGAACISAQVEKGQVQDLVRKRLTDHPEERDKPAAELAADSIRRAFPCK